MFYSVKIIVDEKNAEIIHMMEQRSGQTVSLSEMSSPNTWHVLAIEGVIEAGDQAEAVQEAQRQTVAVIDRAARQIAAYKANVLRGLTVAHFAAVQNYRDSYDWSVAHPHGSPD
jgi:hypothetical protein